MRHSLLPLLLLVTRSRRAGATSLANGNPDCPCINPHPLVGPGTNGANCSGLYSSVTGNCYNLDYGTRGCRPYDTSATDECLGGSPPAWCQDRWCWVAAWNCLRPRAPSQFFPDVFLNNLTLKAEVQGIHGNDFVAAARDQRLTYSYETCGNVDLFTYENGLDELLDDIRSRGPLRISIPGDEPPYIVTRQPGESHVAGTSMRDGSIVRFVTDILDMPRPGRAALPWVEVPISDESRAYSPSSSFTACVHDVALNNTDICVGSFWAFEFRRRLAAFTTSIENVRLYVIAKQRPPNQMLDVLMARPFIPFSWDMWLALFLTLAYAGYAIYTLDATGFRDVETDDAPLDVTDLPDAVMAAHASEVVEAEPENLNDRSALNSAAPKRKVIIGLSAHAKTQLKWQGSTKHRFCPTTYDDAKDLGLAMAQSVQSFTGGNDFRQEPRSFQSWVVFWGMSFLILVSIANYTSQVTVNNINQDASGTIENLDAGIGRSHEFCGWASLQDPIERAEPRLRGLYIPVGDGKAVFQGMDRGDCESAIIDDVAWQVALGGDFSPAEDGDIYANHATGPDRYHCDTKVKPDAPPVFSIDIALPIRSDLQRMMSLLITRHKDSGAWSNADRTARRQFLRPSTCTQEEIEASSQTLQLTTGAGAVMFSIACTTLGLLLNAIYRITPDQRKLREKWTRQRDAYHAAAKALGIKLDDQRHVKVTKSRSGRFEKVLPRGRWGQRSVPEWE